MRKPLVASITLLATTAAAVLALPDAIIHVVSRWLWGLWDELQALRTWKAQYEVEKEFLDAAQEEMVAQIREQEEEPIWQILQDFDHPESNFEFDGHPEHGLIVQVGKKWMPVGADMPEFLPPRRSNVHG